MTLSEFEKSYRYNSSAGRPGDMRVIYPQTTLKEEIGFYTLSDYLVWSITGGAIVLLRRENVNIQTGDSGVRRGEVLSGRNAEG